MPYVRVPPVEHVCPYCGETFIGKSNAVYCPRPRWCRTYFYAKRGRK